MMWVQIFFSNSSFDEGIVKVNRISYVSPLNILNDSFSAFNFFCFQYLMCGCFAHSLQVFFKVYLYVCQEFLSWFLILKCVETKKEKLFFSGSFCYHFIQNSRWGWGSLCRKTPVQKCNLACSSENAYWKHCLHFWKHCTAPCFLCSSAKVNVWKPGLHKGAGKCSAEEWTEIRGERERRRTKV